jgi:cyclophilin family peptidyl-prolyl cis-trans isomerase/HEAT repeat protein
MPERVLRRRYTAALLVVGLGACAPAIRVAPPEPVWIQLGNEEIQQVATLLRLEDRREYDERAFSALSEAAHPEVRRRTALALGRLRATEGMPLLIELLADLDTSVAASAAFGLGQLADTAAVNQLVPWLALDRARTTPTVSAEAAAALGKLATPAAAAALREFLAAAPALPGRNPAVEHALLAIWRHPREPDLSPILRWTGGVDPEVRWRATYALVRRPDPAATAHLLELATDGEPRVRAQALRGLTAPLADSAGVPREQVVPVLLAATHDVERNSAVDAVRALGTFPNASVVTRLHELLSADPALAVAAAESLGRLGHVATPAAGTLAAVARNRDQPAGLRSAALQSLTAVAPGEAAAVVLELALAPGWRARAAAGRALAVLNPPQRAALEALVRDPDPRVGAATLQAAVDAAGDAVGALRPLLIESLGAADVQMRTAALNGLARLRDPATLPALLDGYARAQRDTSNNAALAALDALGALREATVPVANAFVRRFPRSEDYLVRQRAIARLGEPVRRAWGDALPIETGRDPQDYELLVRRWVAPVLAGSPLPRARITTPAGAIELDLFAADAPLTLESFAGLAERGYFDGQHWPRVVPNFVIQGGDPRGDQTGGPGYAIRDEINRHRYERGTLGMALAGPDTGGSQFFITHSPQPHLDGDYTVFGRVVAGTDVVDRVVAGERIEEIRLLP